MNRLQNAKKQLAESLTELESAVEQSKQSSNAKTDLLLANQEVDINALSRELLAIETDLEKAIKIISGLTKVKSLGDEV